MTPKEFKRALIKYFTLYERPDHFIIECDHCNARWRQALRKDRPLGGGNVLHLLNHAYGHFEKPDADDIEASHDR